MAKPSTKIKTTELQLANYIACLTSINLVDHLEELIWSTFEKDFSIHHRKMYSPYLQYHSLMFVYRLSENIGESRYSLTIDKSTGKASVMLLCAVNTLLQHVFEQKCLNIFGTDGFPGTDCRRNRWLQCNSWKYLLKKNKKLQLKCHSIQLCARKPFKHCHAI